MKCYRRLECIKAISFDLDDTLYSNYPVMMATDEKMVVYFHQRYLDLLKTPPKISLNHRFWFTFRQQILQHQPHLIHDVGEIRELSYQAGLMALGLDEQTANDEAKKALDYFLAQRSNFEVPLAVHELLTKLQKKFLLVAISNGNVDTDKIGISKYFTHCFHSGNYQDGVYRQKPANDMFKAACNLLAIEPKQLLHVGDCGYSDILGGALAGCQTAWLSCYDVGQPLTILPNIELSDVVELQRLL